MLYQVIRPLLFSFDPERVHDFTLNTLKVLHHVGFFNLFKNQPAVPVQCMGLTFPNFVGLAAGLDKNGECLPAWGALGFGFVEVGTVTPRAQPGNPKPRLFRLVQQQAIINRMGFNNKGVEHLITQIKAHSLRCPLGVNIGKNKDTPLNQAAQDYLVCFEKVYPYADYVTVNLSSPNTPGLQSLQYGESLNSILAPLKQAQHKLSDKYSKKVPLVVKISPDLAKEELAPLIDHLVSLGIEGVIATNTTIKHAQEEGGLSGAPLFDPSTAIVSHIYNQVGDALPIIAVGGVMGAEHAKAKLVAGAKLVQLYTGLIYRGPTLVRRIIKSVSYR